MAKITQTFNMFLQCPLLGPRSVSRLTRAIAAGCSIHLDKLKVRTDVWDEKKEISLRWKGASSTLLAELSKGSFWPRHLESATESIVETCRPIGGRNSAYAYVLAISRYSKSGCEIRGASPLGSTILLQLIPKALKMTSGAVNRLIESVIGSANSVCEVHYGFVHIEDYHRAPMNAFWVAPTTHPIPELNLSMNAWRYGLDPPETRRERVYGVYWANYLGPHLARKASNPADIGDDFVKHAAIKDTDRMATRFKNGGVLLTLDPDLDTWDAPPSSPHSGAICHAVWLERRFRTCGMW